MAAASAVRAVSQNKTPAVVGNIIEQFAKDNPALAQEMSREHHS